MHNLPSTFAFQSRTPIEIALSRLIEYMAGMNIIPGLQLIPHKGDEADYLQERAVLLPITTQDELTAWKQSVLNSQGTSVSTMFCTEWDGRKYVIRFNPTNNQLIDMSEIAASGQPKIIYHFTPEVDSFIMEQIGRTISDNFKNNLHYLNKMNGGK